MFSLGGGKKEEKENENLVIVLEGWDSREINLKIWWVGAPRC